VSLICKYSRKYDLLRMRNVTDKNYKENENKYFMLLRFAVYEIMWKNTVQLDR
jgi:hypothetical protein